MASLPFNCAAAAALAPGGFQSRGTFRGKPEGQCGEGTRKLLAQNLGIGEATQHRERQVGLLGGHADLAVPQAANNQQQALGLGFGDGTLQRFGIGAHQTTGAQLGATVPANADGQEIREPFALQHPEHGRARGARWLSIVVAALGSERGAFPPGRTMMGGIEIPLPQPGHEDCPFFRACRWVEFGQKDRGFFSQLEAAGGGQAAHKSSLPYNRILATPPVELPNALFGPYRLQLLLGEGGMGRVWKAVDVRLERVVALKILKGDDEDRRRALIAEAKTASQLQHPNIAVVYEAGEVDGVSFIAMEYVEGQNLTLLLGRPLGLAALLNVAIQACKALHHAHLKGVVHRDIKPDNLVLAPDGTLKVLDFGVAKRNPLPNASATAHAFTVTRETEAGISVGTPSYMSPEQVFGHPQNASADQFSLGAVLFELAAVQHPFRKQTLVETLHAIGKEPHPSLAQVRPDLPRVLVKILDRMLAKEPGKRFDSLQDVQLALEPLALEVASGRIPTPIGKPLNLRWKALARWGAALALLGLVGMGAYWLREGQHLGASAQTGLGQGRKVVAVLPVELEGIPPELAWTGHSVQDAMAMGLVRRGDLLVLDRLRVSEVMASVGQRGLAQLQKTLGAEYLVVSTLRGTGEALRLSIRVVRGDLGEVVDQFQVQGDSRNFMELEEEVSRRLPSILAAGQGFRATSPMPRAKHARTRELYTKGLDLVVQGNAEAFDMAKRLFEEAIQAEPDYAPAHAGLGWALLELGATGGHLGREEAKQFGEHAIREGRKAVALDPGLAFAHRVLAEALHRRGDVMAAHTEAQRAVELDPADFRALVALGDAHAYQDNPGDHAEAKVQYQRALELRPTSWFAHYRLAVLLQNDGELEAAVQHADEARRLQPTADYPHLTAAVCLLWLGRDKETAVRVEEGLTRNPDAKLLQVVQVILAHRRGDKATFDRVFARLQNAWGESQPIQVLLQGLREDANGQTQLARERFLAFKATCRSTETDQKSLGERRSMSVNLYYMAEAMALRKDLGAARELLDEAERLHPGKRLVAKKDPLLKGLN